MSPFDTIAKAILSARADAIIATDDQGFICFWNPGAERIFGYTLIIPERLRQRYWEGFRHTIDSGKSRYGDGDLLSVPAIRKDGVTISIEFTIVLLQSESGRPSGLAALLRDVSARFEETRHLKRQLAEANRNAGS